ncbi:diguanylate cyclase [candidate division KSB1 bacterium]|nr:diguanylate cyclase [candidate division KSB1 bacterium]
MIIMAKNIFHLKFNNKEIIAKKDYPYIIGRDVANDIVISHKTVSRRHAAIIFDGEQCIVEDLNSKNGTFVNDRQITRLSLKNSDTIRIGNEHIEVEKEDDSSVSMVTETSSLSQDSIVLEKQFQKLLGEIKENRMLVRDVQGIKRIIEMNRQKLKTAANLDSLTGLYNRGYFDQVFQKEVMRNARYGHSLSILLIDIDFFKQINDKFGHETGDDVLAWVAKMLSSRTRQTDIVARYGGEEFVVLLPETSGDNAKVVAEKICSVIEAESPAHAPAKITVSIGIASHPRNGTNGKIVLKAADTALYQSKNSGRNCITASDWEC